MDDVEITPIVDTNTQDIRDIMSSSSNKKDTSVIDVEMTEEKPIDKPIDVMNSTQPS